MPHIHSQHGQHDITTTAFIINVTPDIPVGLLHLHKKLDILLPVGGHVELDENPWSSILHEIKEESGYDASQLTVLQPPQRIKTLKGVISHPVPMYLQTHEYAVSEKHYHTDMGFIFVTTEQPVDKPANGEVQELIRMNLDEMKTRVSEMPEDVAQIYQFSFNTAFKYWDYVNIAAFES